MTTMFQEGGIVLVVERQEARGAILIRPTGEVDLTSVPILWSNLKALLEDGQDVVVDLSGVQSIDSTGFEALVDAGHLFFQRGQRFALATPTSVVQRLIDIGYPDEVIPVFASIEMALDSFRGLLTGYAVAKKVPERKRETHA